MGRKRIKQYLMLLLVIGVIAVVASGNGTFASFSAQVTNPGNTFASGTLFLHNTPKGGTTCASESGPNNVITGTGSDGGNVCQALFPSIDLATSGPWTAQLALNNAGTIPSSDLKFEIPNCTIGPNSTTTGSSVTFGTAPTCADFYITIQENQDSNYNTNAFCAYGPGTLGVACAAPASSVNLGSPTSFTALQMDNGSHVATPTTLAAGGTRYYTITIAPNPSITGNTLQNRLMTFSMDWQINS